MGDNSLIINISGSADKFIDELDKVKKETKNLEKVLGKTAKASALAFAGFATAIAVVTKSFVDYETALIGVGKTANLEGKKLDEFGKKFQRLSETIPVSTNELLGITQAAAQLGVTGEKNLLKFTETIAKLGVATDLTGEEAATSLARILNVTNENIESIDKLGSVIVALGNNYAASESEIVKVTNEVARSTAVFGVSSAEAAGLATALKSVGIQAQLGGSVVGKAFLKIQKAIDGGGDKLALLSQLTGVAGDELKQTFEDDATGVFESFVNGLGNLEGGTTAVFKALEGLGLKGDEVNKVLPVLAKNSKLLGATLKTAAKETKNATALNEESRKAFASLKSEGQLLQNTIVNLATDIGQELAPTIKEIIVDARNFIKAINSTDNELASNIATFLKWGAVITGAVAGISAFLLGAIQLSALITSIGAAFLPAAAAASAFWIAVTGPVGIAVAGLALVAGGIAAVVVAANSDEKPETLKEINEEIQKLEGNLKKLERKGASRGRTEEIDNINKEIDALKDLRKEKQLQDKDFGTGALLVRPEADAGDFKFGADQFGLEGETTLPFKTEAQVEDDAAAEQKLKNSTKAKEEVLSKAAEKRIAEAQKLNRELKAIQKARAAEETDEAKDVAQRKAEINNELLEANKFSFKLERDLAKENILLKHADELAEIEKFESEKAARKAERDAEKKTIQDSLREEEVANRELLDEEDLLALEEKLLSEDELKKQVAVQEATRVIEDRNKFLADEMKFGETFAKLNQFFRDKDLQNAKTGASQLIQLTQSKNATLNSIGKAAASVNAAIATGEGAIKAYSSLAGIPIVGPALGAGAAAALIAFGVEQQANILGARQGGVVPQSAGRAGVDSVPSLLTPNEIVAPPESFSEVVEGTALARGFTPPDEDGNTGGTSSGGTVTVKLVPTGDFIGVIEQKQIEAEVQNTNVR